MSNSWKVNTFKPSEIKRRMEDHTFTVPRYQRGIVWSEAQERDLVDTIKKGLPFGSLLLYKQSSQSDSYQIIDGLQRSSALVGFVENPAQFFSDDDIDNSVITSIVDLIGVAGQQSVIFDQVSEMLIDWVKKHQTLEDVQGMQFSEFGEELSSQFPTCLGKEGAIGRLVRPMLMSFQKTCETIRETDVPAIVIEGDPDLLPVLFERINSKGTQLSKYQIYAASWNEDKYDINTDLKDLVKANRDRYDSMLGGKSEIDDYDPVSFLNDMVLNAYEIAFGFGKSLCEQYPHLFGISKEETQVESVGFNLLNICLGQRNKDAKTMNVRLRSLVGNDSINLFINRISSCVKYVDRHIGKYSKFKSNSRSDSGKRPLHTEFQICSIIASVFLMQYADISLDEHENITSFQLHLNSVNPKWNSEYKHSFEDNVGKIYISDILQHRWSGTGDKKMDQVLVMPDYYTRSISQSDFESTMDTWFASLNAERQEYSKVTAPKEPELVMIAAVYMSRFSANQQLNNSRFDIEHLATKQLMKDCLARYDGLLRLPISSFGNLCLLPEYENRSKGKKTLYQDSDYLSSSHYSIDEIESMFSFTTSTDFDWLFDQYLDQSEFSDAYYQFIKNRFEKMKQLILGNYSQL